MKIKQRDECLWEARVFGLDTTFFILAKSSIASAQKKADRFFMKRAYEAGDDTYMITHLKRIGIIDVF
jgi:hypothetical protein